MRIISELAYRLRALFRPRQIDSDLDAELGLHLDLEEAKRRAAGHAPADAHRQARAAFGSPTAVADACRDERGFRWLETTVRNVKYGFRTLAAHPVISLSIVGSLALGIGANTALFSILNGLTLRPLPVADPAALALLDKGSWTNPIWEEIRSRSRDLFDGGFAWSEQNFDTSNGGERAPVRGAYVSGEFFDVLGVSAVRGRPLTRADDPSAATLSSRVAVISYSYWQSHYRGADDVIGREILVQRLPFTIVGVAPKGFFGPEVGKVYDLFVPLASERMMRAADSMLGGRSTWWLEVMIRRKAGQTVEQATDALRGVQPQIRDAARPEAGGDRFLAEPMTLVPAVTGRSSIRERYAAPLLAITALVGVVLLVACANIANLLLARATSRRREFSVRRALGATRADLAGMMLIESLMLSAAGALAGLLVAQWGAALLVNEIGASLDLPLDWRVLGFTTALAVATALLFGVGPAFGATSARAHESLAADGRAVVGDRGVKVRNLLVTVQVALSVVLVIGAVLFGRSFARLTQVPLGFLPDRLLVVSVSPPPGRRTPAEEHDALERLQDALGTAPAVRGIAASMITPLSGAGWTAMIGDNAGPPDVARRFWRNAVTPAWFDVYGLRLLAGRRFDSRDRQGATKVAIVNETFARRMLKPGSPIGQVVTMSSPSAVQTYEVVGLVNDAVYRTQREGIFPTMYEPVAQRERPTADITLRVTDDSGAIRTQLGDAIRRAEPGGSFSFRSLEDLVSATVVRERLVAGLAGFFGVLALVLSGIGIYGLMAFAVARRRSEIGLRLALGARPRSILSLVLGRLSLLLAAGAIAGLGLSLWASTLVSTLLFELEPRDPVTLAGAVGALAIVAVIAAWVPARRAAAVDPALVLKDN